MLILLGVHILQLMRFIVNDVVEWLIFEQNSVLRRARHLEKGMRTQ